MQNKINTFFSNQRNCNAATFLGLFLLALAFYAPVLVGDRSLFIEAYDHVTTFVRMADRASWIRSGIIPLWDPKTFCGVSFLERAPTTHLLNLQGWVMGLLGDRLGYSLCVAMLTCLGAYGTYLLAHRRLGITWGLSVAAGVSVAYGPFLGNTYSCIFVFFPFIAFHLYYLLGALQSRDIKQNIRCGIGSALSISLCLYTQEPRYVEFIFYSSVALVVVNSFVSKNGIGFKPFSAYVLVTAFSVIVLCAPLVIPLIKSLPGQQRLGSGLVLPPIFDLPGIGYLLSTFVGNLFPVNTLMFQDGIRLKMAGHFFVPYYNYIHLAYYPTIFMYIKNREKFSSFEHSICVTSLVLVIFIFSYRYIPGFMYLITYLFETGRFLENDVSFYFGILFVFVVINKIAKTSDGDVKWPAFSKVIFSFQFALAAITFCVVLFLYNNVVNYLSHYILNATPHGGSINFDFVKAIVSERVKYILAAAVFIAIQLWLLYRFPRIVNDKLGYGLMVFAFMVTPLLLGKCFWAFEHRPDRFDLPAKTDTVLSSFNILDRIDNVDFKEAFNDSTGKGSFINPSSKSSMEWTLKLYGAANATSIYHFMPRSSFIYINNMYEGFKRFLEFYQMRVFFYPVDRNLFHLAGINYFFSEVKIFTYPFSAVKKLNNYWEYRNEKAFGRYYFVKKLILGENDQKILSEIKLMKYDELKTTGVISKDDWSINGPTQFNNEGSNCRLISYTPNEVVFEAMCREEQFLIINDAYHPNWKAYVDNIQTKIFKVNYLYRGVMVPQGRHRITFVYRDNLFKIMAILAGLMVIICFVYLVKIKEEI